ncbi:hypothetical protein [Sphingobacterium sp. BIGb0165]|uniref:hypothetical protein n=1 Tax=Sphingobacterium sp. BIGb0165 TaxID=2940615 RepID=UPI0021671B39|nr:hypothetical protein [Sphingobacterium sp. BIGb0165]MCS4229060.1 hypothetical protein [Sphingobacterium sp. BIGb0165]
MIKGIWLFLVVCIVIFVLSCRSKQAQSEVCHVIYTIGFGYISLKFDETGNAKARAGRLYDLDANHFKPATMTDSIEFMLKNGDIFLKKLGEFKEPKIESAQGYSRAQIFLNDSLYYDTKMYSSDFGDLFSIISDEIPNEFNPFKTKRFGY